MINLTELLRRLRAPAGRGVVDSMTTTDSREHGYVTIKVPWHLAWELKPGARVRLAPEDLK